MNDLLSWLLAGHMAGDYLFQTRWMAEQKTTRISALAAHSVVYVCLVWLASLPAGGLSPFCVIFVFASHAVIDRRTITLWWCRHITRSDNKMWLVIMVDQSLHIVILAVACLLN
jgi:hypothetical protein